jgi:hypothetical protein
VQAAGGMVDGPSKSDTRLSRVGGLERLVGTSLRRM